MTNTYVPADAPDLRGTPARELVPRDPGVCGRWHTHSGASPLQRWNYHPEIEIHLVVSGYGRFVVGDCIDTFGPGHLVLVGPNLPHHWMTDRIPARRTDDQYMVFQFLPQWLRDCHALLPELAELDPLLSRSLHGIEFSGRTAVEGARLLASVGTGAGAQRLSAVFGLLATMAAAPEHEHRLLTKAWLPPLDAATTIDIIDRAFNYIMDNISGQVRLSTAAALIGMSESAFSKYFRRASGQTFTEVVRKLRLGQACQLLRHTDLPISAIYTRVGYSNLSNFNRQFRETYQVTPSVFRQRERRAAGKKVSELAIADAS